MEGQIHRRDQGWDTRREVGLCRVGVRVRIVPIAGNITTICWTVL